MHLVNVHKKNNDNKTVSSNQVIGLYFILCCNQSSRTFIFCFIYELLSRELSQSFLLDQQLISGVTKGMGQGGNLPPGAALWGRQIEVGM